MNELDINPVSGRLDLVTKSVGYKVVNTGALTADTEISVVHGMAYTKYLFFATDSDGQEVTVQTLKPDPLNPYTAFLIETSIDVEDPGLTVHCFGVDAEGSTSAGFYLSDSLLENQFSYGYQKDWTQPTTTPTPVGNSMLHEQLPIQSEMKRVVLRDDGSVKYELGASDSTEKADGEAANLDGTDGQVMLKKPGFYLKESWNGSVQTVRLSQVKLPGYEWRDEAYVGAYEGYIDGDGKFCSISGVLPTTGQTIDEFRTAAELRGEHWCLFDHDTRHDIDILLTLEYLNTNSQEVVSDGAVNAYSSDWDDYNGYNPVFLTGLTNGLGNVTGEVAQTIANFANGGVDDFETQVFSYRGLENLWGHIWEFVDGVNIKNSAANGSQLYVCKDPKYFASDTTDNYVLKGNIAEADGWGLKPLPGSFIPSAVGGASTTYMTDYFYTIFDTTPESGFRVLLVGGSLSIGSNAGVRFSRVTYSSSSSSVNVGSRLCFKIKK